MEDEVRIWAPAGGSFEGEVGPDPCLCSLSLLRKLVQGKARPWTITNVSLEDTSRPVSVFTLLRRMEGYVRPVFEHYDES